MVAALGVRDRELEIRARLERDDVSLTTYVYKSVLLGVVLVSRVGLLW